MLRWISALLLVAAPVFSARAEWASSTLKEIARLPGGARFVEEEFRDGESSARLRGVVFSSRQCTLRVVDNPGGHTAGLAEAMEQAGCIAGTNGGYFHEDFRPLGLVVSNGNELHEQERARLLSGIAVVREGGIELVRVSEFRNSGVREALQSGPFLIDGAKPVEGLDREKPARRTVLATDGRRNWMLLVLTRCSLSDAAQILSASRALGPQPVRRALNLDGGASTGLWVATPPSPFLLSPLSAVRNYLGVAPLP